MKFEVTHVETGVMCTTAEIEAESRDDAIKKFMVLDDLDKDSEFKQYDADWEVRELNDD